MGQNTSGLKSWFVVTDYFPNDPTQAGNASTSQTNTPAPGGNAIAGQGSSTAGRNASLRRFEDPFGVGPVTIKKLNDHCKSSPATALISGFCRNTLFSSKNVFLAKLAFKELY